MLQTQVNYWQLQETKQHNRSTEALQKEQNVETNRHNLATEGETNRHNLASEEQATFANQELARHNLATEQQTSLRDTQNYVVGLQNANSNAVQAAAAKRNSAINAITGIGNMNSNALNAKAADKRGTASLITAGTQMRKSTAEISNTKSQTVNNYAKAFESATSGLKNTAQLVNYVLGKVVGGSAGKGVTQ